MNTNPSRPVNVVSGTFTPEPLTYKAIPTVTDETPSKTVTVHLEDAILPDTYYRGPVDLEVKPQLSHQQLLSALYWIWDVMDRASMGMFLVYNTADAALKNRDLEGDMVHVGVRKLEWDAGGKRIIDALVQSEEDDGNLAKYTFNGVPIYVHIFNDHPVIRSTDQLMYEREFFKVPNPYKEFLEVFGEWKSQ